MPGAAPVHRTLKQRSMFKRILGWIVLVPLCVVLILFALANRQLTIVNFNPFASPRTLSEPGVGMPLFLVIFGVLLVGVILGGIATWIAEGRVRREKRKWQREAGHLTRELEAQRKDSARRAPPREDLLAIDDLADSGH